MTKYYYVKYSGRWTVAEAYENGDLIVGFYVIHEKNPLAINCFDEIGDEIIMPSED